MQSTTPLKRILTSFDRVRFRPFFKSRLSFIQINPFKTQHFARTHSPHLHVGKASVDASHRHQSYVTPVLQFVLDQCSADVN